MNEVRIRLLGSFDVVVDGRAIDEFESGSARALLARLAIEPGRQLTRTMLAELLWPDRPDGAAAGNLRHSLAGLRRSLGDDEPDDPILIASRSTIALSDRAWVDVPEFFRLSAVESSEQGAVAAWEQAAALRRGPLLAGLDARLSEAWDTWLLTQRAAVDRAAAEALRRLAEIRERTGEWHLASDHVRRWIELEPWNEEGHRMLMRVLALEGRRGAALVHADELVTSMDTELGIIPSQETQALVADIRSGMFPLGVPGAPELPSRLPTAGAGEPCVGRSDELGWLHDRIVGAQTGAGGTVLLVGQPGSGKSVLLHTFERTALESMPNLVVLRGVCNVHRGAGDPFLPFRQILGQVLGDIELDWMRGTLTPREASRLWQGMPTAVEALLDVGPYLLGTLVEAEALLVRFERAFPDHELVERLRQAVAIAEQRGADPTRRRQPLVDQVVRVLGLIALRHPLLVTLDDVQWADVGTLDVLAALSAGTQGVPMLVVATMRPGETTLGPDPVRDTADEIESRASAPCRLELTGTRSFVDAWLDIEPNVYDEAFRDALYQATGGNALFTVEVVGSMKEAGQLSCDDHGRWVAATGVGERLPPRVQATIAARLGALPDELARDLEVGALLGPHFTAELVARVRGVPVHDVVLRLSSLCVTPSSLLRSGGSEPVGDDRHHHYRFRHALFRQGLLDHLVPAVQSHLHESIGYELEQLYASNPDRVAGELAEHFDAAGLIDRAIEYRGLAGRTSAALSAYDDAIPQFERALELLGSADGEPDQRELVLLTSLSACRQAQAGYNAPETMAVHDRLRELTRVVPPSHESAGAIGAMLTVDGLRADYLEAIAGAEQLLELATELEAPPIESIARVHLGWMLLMVGRIVEADEQLTITIERHDPDWDEWLTSLVGIHVRSTALAWRAIVAWHLGRFDEAREAGDESIASARRARFPFGLAFALTVGGCVLGELFEDADRVRDSAAEAAKIAEAEDLAFYAAAAELHGASAELFAGNPGGVVDGCRRGLARWRELGTGAFATWARTWLAEALVRSGQLDAARDELAEIDRLLDEGEERLAELRRAYVGGLFHRAAGDVERAAAEFRNVITLARAARARGPEIQAQAELDDLEAGER